MVINHLRPSWNDPALVGNTLQETNISPKKWHFEDDFPFSKVGYVNPLEGSRPKPEILKGPPVGLGLNTCRLKAVAWSDPELRKLLAALWRDFADPLEWLGLGVMAF